MRTIQKKVCLLGDFAVGKTSLIRRFVEGRFDEKYLSTIGVNISRKSVTRPDYTLNLLIWDLAGGDDYTEAAASYLRGAAGALIVCDLTREETLAAYERYATQLRAVNAKAALVFVANKVDLADQRAISDESLQSATDHLGGPCHFTSAKTGQQVEDAFRSLAERIEANS
jgi:small GTP-binding protein